MELDVDIERAALRNCGYELSTQKLESYRKFVREMSVEVRAEFFFLKANDQLFRPNLKIVGKSLVTNLVTKDHREARFTDLSLGKKHGYFIIAAPST